MGASAPLFLYLHNVLNTPAFSPLLLHPLPDLHLPQVHQFELIAATQIEPEEVDHVGSGSPFFFTDPLLNAPLAPLKSERVVATAATNNVSALSPSFGHRSLTIGVG